MQPWKRKRGMFRGTPKYHTVMEMQEVQLLGELAASVSDALMERVQSGPKDELAELTGMPSGHSEPPEDPRLARLLPDFEMDSDQPTDGENAMLRMLNESDITEAKLEQLRVVLDALADSSGNGEVVLTAEQAQSWIAGLSDLRLYLHVTLENLAGPMEQSQQVDAMYQWLGYNQESLLEELMRE